MPGSSTRSSSSSPPGGTLWQDTTSAPSRGNEPPMFASPPLSRGSRPPWKAAKDLRADTGLRGSSRIGVVTEFEVAQAHLRVQRRSNRQTPLRRARAAPTPGLPHRGAPERGRPSSPGGCRRRACCRGDGRRPARGADGHQHPDRAEPAAASTRAGAHVVADVSGEGHEVAGSIPLPQPHLGGEAVHAAEPTSEGASLPSARRRVASGTSPPKGRNAAVLTRLAAAAGCQESAVRRFRMSERHAEESPCSTHRSGLSPVIGVRVRSLGGRPALLSGPTCATTGAGCSPSMRL